MSEFDPFEPIDPSDFETDDDLDIDVDADLDDFEDEVGIENEIDDEEGNVDLDVDIDDVPEPDFERYSEDEFDSEPVDIPEPKWTEIPVDGNEIRSEHVDGFVLSLAGYRASIVQNGAACRANIVQILMGLGFLGIWRYNASDG